jgi:hypothetical protein
MQTKSSIPHTNKRQKKSQRKQLIVVPPHSRVGGERGSIARECWPPRLPFGTSGIVTSVASSMPHGMEPADTTHLALRREMLAMRSKSLS